MPKLTIGYSTLADRLANVQLPKNQAWEYQFHVQGASSKDRKPLHFYLESTGVAKSRNSAIKHASGQYLLFGDDDVVFNQDQLQLALNYLAANTGVALLLAQAEDENGKLRKNYPGQVTPLNRFNSAKAATYEMIVRVEAIKQLGIRFDEDFGAGAPNYLGDEYIFIADLLRANGRAVFAPFTIAMHPSESSGSRWGKTEDRVARAKVFTRVFGAAAPFVRTGFALRRIKELGGIQNAAKFIFGK